MALKFTRRCANAVCNSPSSVDMSWMTHAADNLITCSNITALSQSLTNLLTLRYQPLTRILCNKVNEIIVSDRARYCLEAAALSNENALESIAAFAPLAKLGVASGDVLTTLLTSTRPITNDEVTRFAEALITLDPQDWTDKVVTHISECIRIVKLNGQDDLIMLNAVRNLISHFTPTLPFGYESLATNLRWIDRRIATVLPTQQDKLPALADWVGRQKTPQVHSIISAETAAILLGARFRPAEHSDFSTCVKALEASDTIPISALPQLIHCYSSFSKLARAKIRKLFRYLDILPAEYFCKAAVIALAEGVTDHSRVFEILSQRSPELRDVHTCGLVSVLGPWSGRGELLVQLNPQPKTWHDSLGLALAQSEAGLQVPCELLQSIKDQYSVDKKIKLEILARLMSVDILINAAELFAAGIKGEIEKGNNRLMDRLLLTLPLDSPWILEISKSIEPSFTARLRLARGVEETEELLRGVLPTATEQRLEEYRRLIPRDFQLKKLPLYSPLSQLYR